MPGSLGSRTRKKTNPRLWEGRWGINTLYGTTQAGTGLLRAGESPQSPYLRIVARTLMSFQNPDGGFNSANACLIWDIAQAIEVGAPTWRRQLEVFHR
jgi:hypothetical protein